MRHRMSSLTLVGLLTIAGCGDDSMLDDGAVHDDSTKSVSSVRIHIDGFKKSKSGAT